ncbi:MAG: adenylate kinase [bacterium]
MRLVLLGAPGSGKGTQAQKLVDRYEIPQISTGDLLRAAVKSGSELGKKAKAAMDTGALVTDDIVLGMIKERLNEPDTKNGFILDGFPRNMAQAEALDALLQEVEQPLDTALLIDVPLDLLLKRLTGRLTCSQCGAVFNKFTSPPKVEGVCDVCGGELIHRADDNEETISKRLKVYEEQTAPLIEYYRDGRLLEVNGDGEVETIYNTIVSKLDAISNQS